MKEEFVQMLKIVCSMLMRPESIVFREPVDWKGLGLIDYPQIIEKPMDLGTIKKNIENDVYQTHREIAADIRLVWTNCMLYNRDGSEFYHLADSFAIAFEDIYSKICRLESSNATINNNANNNNSTSINTKNEKIIKNEEKIEGSEVEIEKNLSGKEVVEEVEANADIIPDEMLRVPSVAERIQLSYDIFQLTATEMVYILTLIEKYSPSALNRKKNKDEILINFDALSSFCFHTINIYVMSSLLVKSNNSIHLKKKKKLSNNVEIALPASPLPAVSSTTNTSITNPTTTTTTTTNNNNNNEIIDISKTAAGSISSNTSKNIKKKK